MGLAIDGNEVHGIARGGQAFVSLGNVNTDGSLNIGGQGFLSKNKMKIKDTGDFDLGFSESINSGTIDVTSNLSNYGGHLAIFIITPSTGDTSTAENILSQPIIIPTVSTAENLSFDIGVWSGSLLRATDNRLTLTVSYSLTGMITKATGDFYVLSNN